MESYEIPQKEFKNNDRYKIDFDSVDPTERSLIQKLESESVPLGDITDISQGITPYDSYAGQDQEIIDNRAYHADEQVDESYGKWLGGKDVSRYEIDWGREWLSYGDWLAAPREEKYFTSPRLLFREVTGGINRVISTYTESEFYYGHSVIPAITEECDWSGEALLAVVNSRLLSWYNQKVSPNAQKETFPKMNPDDVKRLPVHKDTSQKENTLKKESKNFSSLKNQRSKLNTNLIDYVDQNEVSAQLGDIGLFQPANKNNSALAKTSEDLNNLRIGTARVDRESPNTVLVEATARYKPDDEDAHETDQWGYTETEYLPAFRITDLTEREADLIEHFVPVAVDEAGGFADFRETATKTNSLIDRLKAIKLPDVDDVADDLENYLETKARAEELDAKIEQTDELIDQIVYELYGLTDEEIEIVEEAVGE